MPHFRLLCVCFYSYNSEKALSEETVHMKNKSNSKSGGHGVLSASVFGACIGIFIAVLLLIICSVLCILSKDPNAVIAPLSAIIILTVYFSSGFAASKKSASAIPCGALSGVFITAVFFIISLFASTDTPSRLSLPVSLLLRLSFIFLAVLGALLGTNTKSKFKRKRHSKRR